jgi:hypothetical protein
MANKAKIQILPRIRAIGGICKTFAVLPIDEPLIEQISPPGPVQLRYAKIQ